MKLTMPDESSDAKWRCFGVGWCCDKWRDGGIFIRFPWSDVLESGTWVPNNQGRNSRESGVGTRSGRGRPLLRYFRAGAVRVRRVRQSTRKRVTKRRQYIETPCQPTTSEDAIMSSQSQRINKGINSLVQKLFVEIPGEDPDATNERKSNAVEFARELLERYT